MSNMSQKMKPFIYQTVAKLLSLTGMPWDKICNKLGREATLAQLQFLMSKKCECLQKFKYPLNIFFTPYMASFLGNNMVQIILAKALKERGHKITVVLADKVLPICESTDIKTHYKRGIICTDNIEFNERFFRATGFTILRLSELISDQKIIDLKNISQNNDKWDVYVESMLLRYFKVGILDKDNKMMEELKNRARHAAFISEAVGEAIVKRNPDRVVFSHGTYTTRGPFKDIVNQASIPQFSISRAKMAETQKFNWKTPGDWWDVETTWERVKDNPLNDKQRRIINSYLLSRRNHSRDVMVYNFSKEEEKYLTYKKLGLSDYRKTYTLFTNVLWDAASAQREIVFKNSIEWVIETIKMFYNQDDKQLIVRIHPAEKVIGTNQPMYELIRNTIKEIPNNVIVLHPDDPVNSWSLLKITDVGLVHTSTVGMELALEGIPCICVSRTHFRDKGFTIDINNKEDYFSILREGVKNFDREKIKDQALKYSYILFMRYQIPLPFFYPKSHIGINSFAFNDWREVITSKNVKTIVDAIERQSDFILTDEDVYELYG